MKKQAVIYCRISSAGQLKGHGFHRQFETCTAYCVKNDIEIISCFSEVCGSKGSYIARKQAIKYAIYRGAILVIESLDRLGRDGFFPPVQVEMASEFAQEVEMKIKDILEQVVKPKFVQEVEMKIKDILEQVVKPKTGR